MSLNLPEKCMRDRKGCQPLAHIVSDDDSTFICCGLIDIANRTLEQDCFRRCFKSETTDTMHDYDHMDMLDEVSVTSCALTVERKMRNAPEYASLFPDAPSVDTGGGSSEYTVPSKGSEHWKVGVDYGSGAYSVDGVVCNPSDDIVGRSVKNAAGSGGTGKGQVS